VLTERSPESLKTKSHYDSVPVETMFGWVYDLLQDLTPNFVRGDFIFFIMYILIVNSGDGSAYI